MGYIQPNTGDTLNDYFINLTNFTNIADHLLKVNNTRSFNAWFDKLYEIDPRTLLLYLRKHKEKIRPEFIEIAERRLHKTI